MPGLSHYLFLHPCLFRISSHFLYFLPLFPVLPHRSTGHFSVTFLLPSLYARSPAHLAYIIIAAPLFLPRFPMSIISRLAAHSTHRFIHVDRLDFYFVTLHRTSSLGFLYSNIYLLCSSIELLAFLFLLAYCPYFHSRSDTFTFTTSVRLRICNFISLRVVLPRICRSAERTRRNERGNVLASEGRSLCE